MKYFILILLLFIILCGCNKDFSPVANSKNDIIIYFDEYSSNHICIWWEEINSNNEQYLIIWGLDSIGNSGTHYEIIPYKLKGYTNRHEFIIKDEIKSFPYSQKIKIQSSSGVKGEIGFYVCY